MDPELVGKLVVLGSAVVAEETLRKLVGPTAEYYGDLLAAWNMRRRDTAERILINATAKLGDRINSPGQIPPRVFKDVMEEGSWSIDDLAIEYFGGVLASSRTGISRDDRGVAFTKLVTQMTTYQLRAHFLFYSLLKNRFNGSGRVLTVASEAEELPLWISYDAFLSGMDVIESEDDSMILRNALSGLLRHGLIGDHSMYMDVETLREFFPKAPSDGLVILPTSDGAELLLWALGLGHEGATVSWTRISSSPR